MSEFEQEPESSAEEMVSLQSELANNEQSKSRKPRKPFFQRRIVRILLFIGGCYLGVCLLIGLIQKKLIYQPTKTEELAPEKWISPNGRAMAVSTTTRDGIELHGWHVLPPGRSMLDQIEQQWELSQNRPVILYFSGNAGHRGYRVEEIERLTKLQTDVFIFDYRGYGDNRGVPSEERFQADALAIWQYLTSQLRIAAERIVLLGESLGGGVATDMAFRLEQAGESPGGLILKTTFSSMQETAQYHYPWLPVRWLLQERYESVEKIPEVTCPILIIHGRKDTIVPYEQGTRLFEAAPEQSAGGVAKMFLELPGANHNDILSVAADPYFAAIDSFLQPLRRPSAPE